MNVSLEDYHLLLAAKAVALQQVVHLFSSSSEIIQGRLSCLQGNEHGKQQLLFISECRMYWYWLLYNSNTASWVHSFQQLQVPCITYSWEEFESNISWYTLLPELRRLVYDYLQKT